MKIESKIRRHYLLKKLTTMAVGGAADYFFEAKTPEQLAGVVELAQKKRWRWSVMGEGSNLIPADKGFRGLVIKNSIKHFERDGNKVVVGAGNNLLAFIRKLNSLGLAGLEKMAGIPGSVGGAVYGSAGAYGQEIKDRVVRVRFYDTRAGRMRSFSKSQCQFVYRGSIFKKRKGLIITEVTLRLKPGRAGELKKTSREIIALRKRKYRPGLKCPGSFFMNIKLQELTSAKARKKLLANIPEDKVMYGKVAAGYLLEQVGAKGAGQGRVRVAGHHANLIYNQGGARSADIKKLAAKLKKLVKQKFGVKIEEEVQYLD